MKPEKVVGALEGRLGLVASPQKIVDAIETELIFFGLDPASAAEKSDSLLNKVIDEIGDRSNRKRVIGEFSILSICGLDGDMVCGSCYIFSSDADQVKSAKRGRVFAEEMHAHIRGITFAQFEALGRGVLRELGSTTAKVTKHAGDQGIDFYGDIALGSVAGADPSVLRLMHKTTMVVVGQAKHYPNASISTSTVRELIGALSLSRTATYSKENVDLLDGVDLRPFSPVLALLFSTGSFTKGARYLADRAGLIVLSGVQLSVFLADKGVGMINVNGSVKFDAISFDSWLQSDS